MGKFLSGLLLGLILIPILAFLYIRSGSAPVATTASPFPFERKLAQMALRASISKVANTTPPVPASPENLLAGARLYREHCALCHGINGSAPTVIARGMYPPPPALFKGKGVTDDPVGETYWKVANGIRLTGMPGFSATLGETEVWQISQMLANANHLAADAQALLR